MSVPQLGSKDDCQRVATDFKAGRVVRGPSFHRYLQWPVFQPTQPVLDEKAKEHDARRHDVTIERDRKLDRRGGE